MGQAQSQPLKRQNKTMHYPVHHASNQDIRIELKPQLNRRTSFNQISPIKPEITPRPHQQSSTSLTQHLKLNLKPPIIKESFRNHQETSPQPPITKIEVLQVSAKSTNQNQNLQQLEVKRQPTINYIREMKKRSSDSESISSSSFQTNTPIIQDIFSSTRTSVTKFRINKTTTQENSQIIEDQPPLYLSEIGQPEQDSIYQCYVKHQQQRNHSQNGIINYSNNSYISKTQETNPNFRNIPPQFYSDNQSMTTQPERSKSYFMQPEKQDAVKSYLSLHSPDQQWQQEMLQQQQIPFNSPSQQFNKQKQFIRSPKADNYSRIPYLGQDVMGQDVMAQFNQLNQEKRDLQGMTEQQKNIINQQFQLLLQLSLQSKQNNNTEHSEKQSPIIINNNILSPDVYKRDQYNQENKPPQRQEELYKSKLIDYRGPIQEEYKQISKKDLNKSEIKVNKIEIKLNRSEIQQNKPEVNKSDQKTPQHMKTPIKSTKKVENSLMVSPVSTHTKSANQTPSNQRSNQINKNDELSNREPTLIKKGIKIDFNFDSDMKDKKQTNLADCFKARKRTVVKVVEPKNDLIQKSLSVNPSMKHFKVGKDDQQEDETRDEWVINVQRRSKEEQIKLRKDMMNYGKSVRQNHRVSKEEIIVEVKPVRRQVQVSPVLERLAMGIKIKVPEKEMYALTKKNYENLPEVKQKKNNAETKQQRNDFLQDRKSKIKDLQKETRNRLFKKKDVD